MFFRKLAVVAVALTIFQSSLPAKDKSRIKKPMDPKTLTAIKLLSDIQVAPNGIYGAYVVTERIYETNSTRNNIWLFSAYGGDPKKMTQSDKGNFNPRWAYDDRTLGFISTRSGSPQIWLMDIKGGEPKKLTDFTAGINDFAFSPDKKHIFFVAKVYKGCSNDKCVKERKEKKEKEMHSAKVIEGKIYRHWNEWLGDKISRLFQLNIDSGKITAVSPEGLNVPPIALGHGFSISPDGKFIAYTSNNDKDLSRSTNNDIFLYSTADKTTEMITTNKGNDFDPAFSPDGKLIAYLSQNTPGYESDKINLVIYDRKTKKPEIVTGQLDRWVYEYVWAPNSKTVYLATNDSGYREVYSLSTIDKAVKKMTIKTYNKNLQVAVNGKFLLMLRESFKTPPEIYRNDLKEGKIVKLTNHNDEILKNIEMGKSEEFTFKSKDGTQIYGFMLFPPFFNPKKKYPWLLLIHGGPQGMWANSFHPRWNTQMFAAPGYVTAAINFRGSTGYGQDFTAQISKDYSGKAYEDIMTGVDWLLEKQKFLDKENFCALGGSFGGFMVNWLEANTERFTCLVSHAGVSDQLSMYGTTEEKWFPEWDIGGTPYENFEAYKKLSPVFNAKSFKTPLLILHGEQDFRVPLEQAMEMYTAAQYAGIDTKLILFPDEGHWIWKPRNAVFWWNSIHAWLAKYLKK